MHDTIHRDAPALDHDGCERTVTTTWPTIAATRMGRIVGRLCDIPWGLGRFFTVGKLFAAATIPISLGVFAWQLLPYVCRRYTITNRRLVVQKGYRAIDERSIALHDFDAVDIVVLSGQRWLRSGELVFKRAGGEVFRLSGVSHPVVLRQVCLTTQAAVISVGRIIQQQAEREPAASAAQ